MLKQQIEPYREFAQHYHQRIEKDTVHDFRYIEKIISRLNLLSPEISFTKEFIKQLNSEL